MDVFKKTNARVANNWDAGIPSCMYRRAEDRAKLRRYSRRKLKQELQKEKGSWQELKGGERTEWTLQIQVGDTALNLAEVQQMLERLHAQDAEEEYAIKRVAV